MASIVGQISFSVVIFLLCFPYQTNADAHSHPHRRPPAATVVGKIYCDTCFNQQSPKLIAGAVVAIECDCGGGHSGVVIPPAFQKEAKTNKHGVFRVHLPDEVGKHVARIKACSVKLIKSTHPFCAVASSAITSSTPRLKSRKHGTRIFSAGFFTFRPLEQPDFCNEKPQITAPSQVPGLPTNPFQPPSVLQPNPFQPPSFLPSNPFQSPSLLPPNPFEPSPSTSILPRNPFQRPPPAIPPLTLPSPPFFHVPSVPTSTPPPPFFNIPIIPIFIPSPSSPAFQFPPFFTPPSPHFQFPGAPSASSKIPAP